MPPINHAKTSFFLDLEVIQGDIKGEMNGYVPLNHL